MRGRVLLGIAAAALGAALGLAQVVPPGTPCLGCGRQGIDSSSASGTPIVTNLIASWGGSAFTWTASTNALTAVGNDALGSCGATCDLGVSASAPTVTGGATGLALALNGTTEYLSVADNAPLSLDSKDALFCAWVYPTSVTGAHALLSKDDIATQREYALIQNAAASTQMFSWSDTDALSTWSGTALSINTRAFVCGAIDVSAKKSGGSVNGAAITWSAGAWATGTTIKDGTAAFAIGVQKNAAPANYWAGREGIAVVYEATTLDFDAVITALYNSGKGQRCADVSTTNLVTCWNLDETSSTRASDAGTCGSACDLAPTGTPGAQAGLVQTKDALSNVSLGIRLASASSQYATVADNAPLSTGDVSFSASCWYNPTAAGTAVTLMAKGTEYQLGVSAANQATWLVDATTATETTTALAANTWYMVTGTRDAGVALNIAVNADTFITAADDTPTDAAAAFMLGSLSTPGTYANGVLADCGFWKARALSQADVTTKYASGAGRFYDWAWQLMQGDLVRWAFRALYDPWRAVSRDANFQPAGV